MLPVPFMSSPRALFAFSPLIDPAAFDEWKRSHGHAALQLPPGEVAEAVGVDLVYSCPSKKWGGRIAALTPVAGKSVFGKLFRIRPEDWAAIVEAETGRGEKLAELEVQVRAGGKMIPATAFAPRAPSTDGPVSESYARALAKAAEAARLPADYVDRLKAEAELLHRVQSYGQKHGLSNG